MKEKERKKRKPSKIRFLIAALVFLIGTLIIIGLFVVPFFIHTTNLRFYFFIPLGILYIFNTIVAIFIFNSKVQINFKLSWLVVVVVFPVGGLVIYMLYANKITTKRMKKLRFNKINLELWAGKVDSEETLKKIRSLNGDQWAISRYLYKHREASVFENTEVNYYKLGQHGYPYILKELKKAERFIFIEYYIIEDGFMFDKIYKILKEKAKQGIDVRLIYDDFGSVMKVDARFFKDARKDGIKCFAFNRIRPFVDIRQNSRDHRKIIVIDGVRGFTGGCNLSDEYINKKKRFGLWKDNFVLIKGEGVTGLTNLFLSNWSLINKDVIKDCDMIRKYSFYNNKECLKEELNIDDNAFVQTFGELPFDGEDGAKNVYLQMVSRAKKYIYISTPYLSPDSELLTALINAAKSGITVKIVTPGIPDKKLVFSLTRSYYSSLLAHGVEIFEYTPGFNHCKIIVVDDCMAMTGTVNFDYRSLYLNFENAILFFNGKIIQEIKNDLEEMISVSKPQRAREYINKPLIRRIYWGVLRIISPLL